MIKTLLQEDGGMSCGPEAKKRKKDLKMSNNFHKDPRGAQDQVDGEFVKGMKGSLSVFQNKSAKSWGIIVWMCRSFSETSVVSSYKPAPVFVRGMVFPMRRWIFGFSLW